jgi:hypothetical protein
MDIYEIYRIIRSQIEHVDNTISQRIVWLVLSQSFFFSGYSILVTGVPKSSMLIEQQQMLLTLFPVSALLMNVVSLIDIVSGMVYLKKLSRDYNERGTTAGGYPPIEGYKNLNRAKNSSSLIVPLVFLTVWMIILLKR